jgi:hypothetical protein
MRPESLPSDEVAAVGRCHEAYIRLRDELAKVIVGQHEVIEQVLVAMLAQGHALLEGVPGLAKTLLVSSLARALDLTYKRIQFTPDLMPSDVTGTEVIQEDPQTHQRAYRFLPGPVFANLLLADEINRTPPKTPAATATRFPARFSFWPRRTRSSRKAPIRCPKPSSIASCCTSSWAIPAGPRSGKSPAASPAASSDRSSRSSAVKRSSNCNSSSPACR